VVEDNPELQEYLRAMLPPDYHVTVTGNGRAALDHLEIVEQLPDLILSDVMMPLMDGFQLLETLRSHERWRNIPVILLTALTGHDDRMRAFRIGIDDYITKPFSPEELHVRIENALRNGAARREWTEAGPTDANTLSSTDAWVLKLRETARENLRNPQFNVDDLADRMDIGRSTLYRLVRERTGLSANQLIQELRLLQARELLETGQYRTWRQLAEAVGFRSPDYLSRLYRARFGKSLSDGFSEEKPTQMT
jgi:DNA-binding response OmpR family regulator